MERLTQQQMTYLEFCQMAYDADEAQMAHNRYVSGKLAMAGGLTQVVLRPIHDPARTLCLALFDAEGHIIRFVDCRRYMVFDDLKQPASCHLGGTRT